MKKKIILALTACLFAAGTIIHYNLAENTSRMDVSLADISLMAQADGEYPPRNDRDGACQICWFYGPGDQLYIGVEIYCWDHSGGLCIDTSCGYGTCV